MHGVGVWCCFRLGRCVGERDREIDGPEVVSFVDGRTDGSATFNPGVKAVEVGDSDVTLTNSSTGQSVSFEVEVTAPRCPRRGVGRPVSPQPGAPPPERVSSRG